MIPLHIAQQLADALRDIQSWAHNNHETHNKRVYLTDLTVERIRQAIAAFEAAKAQPVRVKLPPTLCVEDYSAIGRTRAAFTGERATVEVINRALVISALKDQGIEVAE